MPLAPSVVARSTNDKAHVKNQINLNAQLIKPTLLNMEIGGKQHADEKTSSEKDPIVSERPEFAKSRRCKGDKCQQCTSKIECWHGVDVLEDVLRSGHLGVKLFGVVLVLTPSLKS